VPQAPTQGVLFVGSFRLLFLQPQRPHQQRTLVDPQGPAPHHAEGHCGRYLHSQALHSILGIAGTFMGLPWGVLLWNVLLVAK
jgi:hypothetical protein